MNREEGIPQFIMAAMTQKTTSHVVCISLLSSESECEEEPLAKRIAQRKCEQPQPGAPPRSPQPQPQPQQQLQQQRQELQEQQEQQQQRQRQRQAAAASISTRCIPAFARA